MQASLLRDRISIYVPVLSRNEYGEQVQTYEKLYDTHAEVVYTYGNRSVSNNEVVNDYSRVFRVRRYVQVSEKCQIKYNGDMYRILSIEEIRPSDMLVITTEKINQ